MIWIQWLVQWGSAISKACPTISIYFLSCVTGSCLFGATQLPLKLKGSLQKGQKDSWTLVFNHLMILGNWFLCESWSKFLTCHDGITLSTTSKKCLNKKNIWFGSVSFQFTNGRSEQVQDCDPGHDDFFAILMCANPSIELIGVSTVGGNQTVEKTTINALKAVQALGPEMSDKIPVVKGQSKPMIRVPKQ